MDTTSGAPGLGASSPHMPRAKRTYHIARLVPSWLLLLVAGSLVLTACGGGGGGSGGGGGNTPLMGSPPAVPTDLSSTPGNSQVSLVWTGSPTATSYDIYVGTTAGGESTTPAATGATTTSYAATGLSNGTTYYFKVAAVNIAGTSPLSTEVKAIPALAPAAPSNVAATPGNGQLILSWTASTGATSYSVYQGLTPGGETVTPIASGLTNPTLTITGLTNGGIYFYTVTATNIDVTGPFSVEIAAVPVAAPVANGQLASGVVVLSAAQSNQIVSATGSLVTFAGTISIPQGTVFLTNDNAYIADTSKTSNGQTLVSVHAPQVDDVFSKLQISGTFPLTSDAIVTGAAQAAGRSAMAKGKSMAGGAQAVTGNLTQIYPIKFSSGGFSANGNLTANLSVNISFDYSSGALQSANITVNQTNQTSITAGFTPDTSASQDFPLTTFSIPIPVSVVDSILNAVGVHVASIQVPVSVLLSGEVHFSATAVVTGSSQATASTSYTSGSSPTVTGSLSGSTSFAVDPSSVSTAGDDVIATLQVNAALYLRLRPALAFLNTVALLGADVQAGPSAQLDAQVVAETPPYCLEVSKSLDGQVSGFFKTIGVNVTTSSFRVSKAFPPPVYLGSCTLATNVTAMVDSSSLPATYYSPILVEVSVTPQSSSQAQGKVPSSTATVSMNGNTCTATLGAEGSGSCTLPASPAGTAVPYQVSYNGDSIFSPASNASAVDVAQSNSVTGLTIPAMNDVNTPVTFSASVIASPVIGAASGAEPSGDIDIVDPNNATLCVMTLNSAATGSCNASFMSPISETITAHYSGDTNYLASDGTAMLVVAHLPTAVTVAASQSSVPLGTAVKLSWISTNASSCVESGGSAGDLWGGTAILVNGNQSVTESAAGTYTYTMTCGDASGNVSAPSSVTVTVTGANPWVGNWIGTLTAALPQCGGPAPPTPWYVTIGSNGGNFISVEYTFLPDGAGGAIPGTPYTLIVSGNRASAGNGSQTGLILSGNTITYDDGQVPNCQLGMLTLQ